MKKIIKLISIVVVAASLASQAFAQEVNLYFTRHGKTMFNNVHRAQGWSDTPLTKPGIEVAQQLGRGLGDMKFIAVYSSDLGRARQTARIILETKGDPININEMEALRETCFGDFEGDLDPNMWTPAAQHLGYESDKALMEDFGKGKITLNKMMDAIAAVEKSGEAENYNKVKTRMQTALKAIAKQAQAQGGGNVLVVTHGMAIMAMVEEMQDQPITAGLGNASVTKIRYTDDGKFIVESLGDMSYVEKGKTLSK
ncbi:MULTISPECIES: histidine phosphatase family protein [unclassified Gilliamella]|uniref:histidine phosphatase family protein n=1 Tax=unclassified Gilliamella TaxID=2685620 RepID=UPI001C69BA15|nr:MULTISPECIES: histidine phosphatase family protein [unclassified Gilliamella]MCX8601906.1 histidine phosphatase family protein [Gilliamella sp. B3722]MCX8607868.1 histidine phosphatase family protein [Gilliamella sp. B3771]MCX8611172.1 histidine phosphatase family protein [Gilliamella sp. B3891]MCX8613704.1 histidine phosphatase family protein [Gilliamella sp. B3773]MCX8615007.1 histidine phosphatase family protein [Gilliamella sp. B3770]